MFVPFLIMLREGLEAALIVSLIASYLKRTQRGRWIGVMWIGVLLAAALCLGLGIFINETTGEFPQKEQELFEGIVAVIAVVILTWMVFWMRKVSRNVKVQLEQAVDSALQRGNHHGCTSMVCPPLMLQAGGDISVPWNVMSSSAASTAPQPAHSKRSRNFFIGNPPPWSSWR